MSRAHEKLVRLERMRLLLTSLRTLDARALAELQELVAPHPYPGINIALAHERAAVAAEVERRAKGQTK